MKHVVITGASRGVGFGLAQAFLELGCRVTLAGRTESSTNDARERLVRELPGARDRIGAHACDVTESDQLEALWQHAVAIAPVDVWINNAGVSPRFAPIWELSARELRSVIDTNVDGVLIGSWVAMRGMREQKNGVIYNALGFGSDGTILRGALAYGASKRSVDYVTKALAREAHGSGVRICAMDPCAVHTEMVASTWSALGSAKPWVGTVIDALALQPLECGRLLARRLLRNQRSNVLVRPWSNSLFWLRVLTLPVLALLGFYGAKARTRAQ
jgi:NAD(P)-dependent dehydrogenase (short-subunit alcohol dehydrogenase family)